MVKAVIVTDLGFGDSGKGTITDFLVRRLGARLVVRHNGGAQAGHTVVLSDGRAHTFSQFGAGTFVPGVRTFLSRFMVVHPGGLLEEARVLRGKGVSDALERISIDPRALVITPFHQAANRLREVLRGNARHGSCGLGVGETTRHSLEHPHECVRAGELLDLEALKNKLLRVQQRYWQEFSQHRRELALHPLGATEMVLLESPETSAHFLEQARGIAGLVQDPGPIDGTVIFEGAQGVLLDEWRGFHPYTTWSTCTFDNAQTLAQEWGAQVTRLGVVRSYATRHGAGPFPTEDEGLRWPEPHNRWGPWQESFRSGHFDAVLFRYAVECCGGLDGLAVTHLDRLRPGWKVCRGYGRIDAELYRQGRILPGPFTDLDYQERLGKALEKVSLDYQKMSQSRAFCEQLSQVAEAPVMVTSHGPTPEEKSFTEYGEGVLATPCRLKAL